MAQRLEDGGEEPAFADEASADDAVPSLQQAPQSGLDLESEPARASDGGDAEPSLLPDPAVHSMPENPKAMSPHNTEDPPAALGGSEATSRAPEGLDAGEAALKEEQGPAGEEREQADKPSAVDASQTQRTKSASPNYLRPSTHSLALKIQR